MTLLFCDSFDHYASADTGNKWDQVFSSNPYITTGGRFGSNRFVQSVVNGCQQVAKFVPSYPTYIVGFAMKLGGGDPNYCTSMSVIEFRDQTTVQCKLTWDAPTQYLHAYTAGSTDRGVCSSYVSYTGVWRYYEIKVTVHDSAGAIEVREDGTTMLSLSGIDTQATGNAIIDRITLGGAPNISYTSMSFDDFYICDDQGGVNDDFLGDVRVQAIFPSANGNSSQLVGSDANSTDNYLLVDETSPSTADYVESSTSGQKDTYTYSDLATTAGSVLGIQILPYAAKTDAGVRNIASVARLSGTEVDGPDKTLSATATYLSDIREEKPGGGAWSIANVNDAEFGVKITA